MSPTAHAALLTAVGLGLALASFARQRGRGSAALDAPLVALWIGWWVELGVTLLLGQAVQSTDADNGRSGWDPIPTGIAAVDRLGVPSGFVATAQRSPARRPGTWRVALVGDSFTAGQGVEPDHTLAAALQRALQAARPDVAVEVLNHGYPGFGTWELEAVARDETRWWTPDVVVWVHVLNDLPSTAISELGGLGLGMQLDDAIVDRTRDARPPGPWWTLELGRDLVRRQLVARAVEELYRKGHDPLRSPDAFAAFRSVLTPLVTEQKARGGRFVVATYPLMIGLEDYPFRDAHGAVLDLARAAGAEAVDLLGPFEGRAASDLWARREDHHPNALGHELAANALARALLQREPGAALPSPCTVPAEVALAAIDAAGPDGPALAAAGSALRCADPTDPRGPLAQARAHLHLPRDPARSPFRRRHVAAIAARQAAALDALRPGLVDHAHLGELAEAVRALD